MTEATNDIALIRRLMHESQSAVYDGRGHFVLWGLISALGLALTYAYVVGWSVPDPRLIWLVALALGWAGSIALGMRGRNRARVHTHASRLLGWLWISCAATMTLVGTAGLFGDVVPVNALPGLVSAILAVGVLGTGVLTGHSWLRWVAVCWWVGAAVMLFRPGVYALLLLAVMAVLLEVVPGLVLMSRKRGVPEAASDTP